MIAIKQTLESKVPLGRCPICQQPAVLGSDNPTRPFCSERCRLIDLGCWMSDNYAVPGDPVEPELTTGQEPDIPD